MPTALVTGCSSGIGRVTALALAEEGFHLVAAGRSEARTKTVVEAIGARGASAEFLHVDLASLDSVRQAAGEFLRTDRTLDVLVNNAGVGGIRGITADGFEIHFGVNHLGHFLLTRLLEPSFRPGTRIVQVTSAAHFNADGIDFGRARQKTRLPFGWREYGESKLANVLFIRELARRHPEWRTYAVHPGMTDTNIIPRWVRPFVKRRLFTPEQGAETVIWCATSPEVAGETGLYYRRKESRSPAPQALDDQLALELWERSERWCGLTGADPGRTSV